MIGEWMRTLIRQFRPAQAEPLHFPDLHKSRNEIATIKARTQMLERVIEDRERTYAEVTRDVWRHGEGGGS